jgi:Tol biopolymer transport system component
LVSSAATVVALATLGAVPARAAAPGAPGRIAYVFAPASKTKEHGALGTVESVLPDGSGKVKIAGKAGSDILNPEYSADGGRIAWVVTDFKKTDGVYVAAADGSGAKRVAKTSWTDGVAWSPDGKTVVYADVSEGVYAVPADGSAAPTLLLKPADDGGNYRRPTFSPDGATIVVQHDTLSSNMGKPHLVRSDFWRFNADGTGLVAVFAGGVSPKFKFEPDFSPDGTSLVFDGYGKGKHAPVSVYVASADGTGVRSLFTASKGDWIDGPTWSPDGTKIVLATGGSIRKGAQLLVIDTATGATTSVKKVTNGLLEQPSWQAVPTP